MNTVFSLWPLPERGHGSQSCIRHNNATMSFHDENNPPQTPD
jgi:hypothetical protein